MTFISSFKLALNGLRVNKKRAFLTMLGIIIGTGAVIIIMSVGAGAQSLIINELSGFGANLFGVLPGAASDNGPPASVMGITVTTLKLDEVEDIAAISHVEAVTAYVRGVATVAYGNLDGSYSFIGVNSSLPDVESANVERGRFFTEDESDSLARVVVLGFSVKQDLFGDFDAIGENIKIKKQNFRVVGVMEELGTVAFENKDQLIYIPIKTAQRIMLGINHVSMIRGIVSSSDYVESALEEVRAVIRANHNIDNPNNDDFTARSMNQALKVVTSITGMLKLFLTGIAAVSLVVGGVGIMNIMLVTITERTKEIGLRKSVGATRMGILSQFLVESATITMIGGIIGIIGGILTSWGVATTAQYLGYKWDFIITTPSILLGIGVSAAVGIIFGLYPANQAARMQPVDALRAD